MKTKFLFIAALTALTFTSCDIKSKLQNATALAKEEYKAMHEYRDSEKWGKVIEKDIKTADFERIQINGAVDIIYTQGDSCTVRVYGNEKAIEKYQFFTNDDQLVVGLENYKWESRDIHISQESPAITVLITSPSISQITVYGAGDINLGDSLSQSSNLYINVNGASDITGKHIDINNLDIIVNGAGDVTLKKVTCQSNANLTVNGAGDVEAKIKCANAKTVVNGAGDIDLDVKCDELSAECNGAGDIKLKGECKTLNKKDGIASSIDSRDLKITGKTNLKK